MLGPRLRIWGIRALSCALFVAWKAGVLNDGDADGNADSHQSAFLYHPSALTKVLIVRTVWPSEVPTAVDDVLHVGRMTGHHEELRQKSRSQCGELQAAGYAATLNAHANGSESFPNHLLCNSGDDAENNFFTVRADFMLFAKNSTVVDQISTLIDQQSDAMEDDALHDMIVIKDVSKSPKKLVNWFRHCTEDRLANYDYVWFFDGDVPINTLNWHAFWQQVKLMRPKITQACTIGRTAEDQGTVHDHLRCKADSRLLAAEVPIVEYQNSLLETETWLGYRRLMMNHREVMEAIGWGSDACVDMSWCHYARNNMTGNQGEGAIWWQKVRYYEESPTLSLNIDPNSDILGRGCIVLYQTPIVHLNQQTMKKDDVQLGKGNGLLCSYFRQQMGVAGKRGLKTVWELFNAPEIQM